MEGQPDYWTAPLFQLEEHPVGLDQIDPSTATDACIIDYLRAKQRRRESENAALGIAPTEAMNAHLGSLHPSELPCCFVAAGLQWQTSHGLSKQKKEGGYTAVRPGGDLVSGRGPYYIGVKRTLEFYQPNGAKTGWAVVQYNKLDQAGDVYCSVIDEKLIFYKVFELRNDGNLHYQAPLRLATNIEPLPVEYTGSFFDDHDYQIANFNTEHHPVYGDLRLSPLRGDQLDVDWLCDYLNQDEVPVALQEPEEGRARKRMRSRSAVWEHFAKIDGKDPQNVYAACLCCDGLLKAHSKKHGTSLLLNHWCSRPETKNYLVEDWWCLPACVVVSLYPQ